jgi:hypothetical protein
MWLLLEISIVSIVSELGKKLKRESMRYVTVTNNKEVFLKINKE